MGIMIAFGGVLLAMAVLVIMLWGIARAIGHAGGFLFRALGTHEEVR